MKNLICTLVFTIITLAMSHTISAQENTQYVIDSLSAEVKRTTGEYKLKTLERLAELEIFSTNLLSRLDDLEREAKEQQNDYSLLSSYNYRITYYIRNNNTDSISKYTMLSAPIAKQLDPTDQFVARNELLRVVGYTTRGLFDLALIDQKKYLEKIQSIGNVNPEILYSMYIGIGDTYYHQENYPEALKYYDQAKNQVQNIDNNPIRYISSLCLLALCHTSLKNYAEAIQYCNLASSNINDDQKIITSESRTFLNAYVNLIAIQAYVGLKDFGKAKPLIDQLRANLDAPYYQEPEAYCYSTLRVYYSGIEDYQEALNYTELGLAHLKKHNNIIIQPAFIKEKSALLYKMKNYKDAHDELLNATQLADSIRNHHFSLQLNELSIMYEVNVKDAEIAKTNSQLKYTQAVIIALIVLSLLLLIILLVVRINSRKQLAKNKILFKQQEELRKNISYYKKMIVDATNNNIPNVNPLFQKLEDYMLEEEAYKNPDISREDIAAVLNTNRQYLSSAIKDATGLTFTNYINKYRLEDARKQLLENDEVVIDDIIIEAGFSSRPTFHRLFKEHYGMAPNELKLASITLQKEIMKEKKDNL